MRLSIFLWAAGITVGLMGYAYNYHEFIFLGGVIGILGFFAEVSDEQQGE